MSEALAALQDRSFARATSTTVGSYPPERRLAGPQLAGYLDRRVFAVIGSRRPDGRPHAAMSVFVRRGTAFWLPTAEGTARERNMRREPWLTLTVTEGDRDAHIVVLIEGPADVVPVAGPRRCPGRHHRRLGGHLDPAAGRARALLRLRGRPAVAGACARSPGTAPLDVVGHDGEEAVHRVHEPGVGEDREADDDGGEVGHQHQSVGRGGA